MAQVKEVKSEQKPMNLRYQRDKDREKVKGIFRFYEVPGGSMSFCFKQYKEDPVERYDMIDGEIYTIPLGVAKHLNKNGWYPEYGFIQGEKAIKGGFSPDGQWMKVTKKIRRFGFQSLEFLDIDELPTATSEIVTVEHLGV